jgi:hypothetical protein
MSDPLQGGVQAPVTPALLFKSAVKKESHLASPYTAALQM